ncbi:PAS domain S-box protein [Tychonema sp. BBK16]|uniref:PAS domain S-box protein n=1 Tax=Tychonema sp. BBK16 TaxID=2699888 RepID=UPI001F3D1F94|nr:PAS domain S-box protein [Tychonema sp. BBK16]MCF6375691.1 PAS domain S-box protein [Tychonema sp. BBK16]
MMKNFQISPYLAAISASVAILSGVCLLDRSEQLRFWQYNRANTINQLSTVRSNLEGGLNSRLFLMRGLVAYVSQNPNISEAEFAAMGKILLANQAGISSIGLVKSTTIAYMYPLVGNESAIGVDLMTIPTQRQMVEEAIATRKTVLAGPVKLLAGNIGFISRSPIFLTPAGAEPETGVYWGLTGVLIDQDILLNETGIKDPSAKLQYALRGKDGKGVSGEVFFGDGAIFQQDPVLLEVTLPSGSWQLAAIPLGGWQKNSPFRGFWLTGGGLLALLSGVVTFNWVYGPAKLRASEAKYRQLVENANSIIVQLDSRGNITFFNEFAESVFGYSQAEIIGKSAIWTLISGADLDILAITRDFLPHAERYFNQEHEVIHRNGGKMWIVWRNQPLLNEKGHLRGLLCVGTDISDRKKAEIALQDSEAELRALFAAMNDVIFVIDREGRYLKVAPTNPELLYKPPAEIINKTLHELFPLETADYFLSKIQLVADTKQNQSLEYSLQIGNREIWFVANIAPMQENTVIWMARDITKRKQAESWLAGQKEILEMIAKGTLLGDTLNALVKIIEQQSRDMMGSILLLDQEGKHLMHGVAPSLPESYNAAIDGVAIGPNIGSCGTAAYRKESVIVTDIANDPLWENYRDLALSFGLRACWSIPIFSSQSQLLGTFVMYYSGPRTPEEFEWQLIEVARNLAGIAIEQKQAEESLQQVNEDLENRVIKRTSELSQAFVQLQTEIAERQETEKELMASESRFQKLAANLPGMIYQCLLRSDNSVSFPYVSPACREMFELEPEAIQQNSDLLIDLVHPDDSQDYYESITISAKNIQPWLWEGRLILPSSKIKWFQVNARPESTENGDILWDGITIDITDRKQAEAALQESQQFIQKIADATPGILYLYDLEEQRNIYANSSVGTLLGYTFDETQEMGSMLMPQLLHPEDMVKILEYHASFAGIKDGEVWEIEYRMLGANGEWFWLQSRDTIFSRNADNQPKVIIGFAQNITTRKQAEAALRQSEVLERERAQQLETAMLELRSTQAQLIQTEKMSSLGELVAGIAHEINNPVNFIHGNIKYLNEYTRHLLDLVNLYAEQFPQPNPIILNKIEEIDLDFMAEDLIKIVSSMQVGTQRIRQIVLSLRNFSRLDESEMKPVDIHAGIESTLLILQHRLKGLNGQPAIQVINDFGKLPLVECYPSQLNQVFMNIIANGIDAIEERYKKLSILECEENPGTIAIATKVTSEKMLAIEISDNGMGMPQSVIDRIFNPFYTTKEVGKGTGLGMSISHSIVVEKHKGKIECISEIGRGTTFRIQIPIG